MFVPTKTMTDTISRVSRPPTRRRAINPSISMVDDPASWLGSAFEPDVLGVGVAHQAAGRDRLEALQLSAMGIEDAHEHRQTDAAVLVHQGLHLAVHLLALGLVGLAARRDQKLVELLVLPRALVPGRVGLEEQREQ